MFVAHEKNNEILTVVQYSIHCQANDLYSSGTVSYTHLDVYKRQVYHLADNILFTINEHLFFPLPSMYEISKILIFSHYF